MTWRIDTFDIKSVNIKFFIIFQNNIRLFSRQFITKSRIRQINVRVCYIYARLIAGNKFSACFFTKLFHIWNMIIMTMSYKHIFYINSVVLSRFQYSVTLISRINHKTVLCIFIINYISIFICIIIIDCLNLHKAPLSYKVLQEESYKYKSRHPLRSL